ncbi:WD repeat-containing protein 6 [Hyla sarda]|uniref:WD repeat-containing protein 6 n=1 Tax=Hyla sarda TaxID=327740 RepID=UPI0024C41B2A|nr:WD repeat-containing protein 6 [Hyla sarda]XP_056380772.1 WD repeat-containing protein 6 [Hyla sarda]XP_056380773.1 WD repeat-containing protein 6 [Hyla sarda]
MRFMCITKMESQLLLAPITALEFVGDHLLAGEGPNLTVYTLRSSSSTSLRLKENVLAGYTIHGIKPCGSDSSVVCVFGSKGLVVLNFSTRDQEVRLSKVCNLRELHDWIWDVQWLGDALQSTAYLGLALGHNSVAYYDYKMGKVLKEIHCSEKCILYSAHFVGTTWEKLTLISGTVFNQLVIWGMSDQINEEGRVEPRRRISGHDGVIFSIYYEKQKGVLASASDDRSIRVWNVGSLTDRDPDVKCLLLLYGHQARVWSVRLLPDNIISIGEDSACIVWSYSGDIIHNFKGHKGRGIRAVSVQDELGLVATGGADSGIRLWQIREKTSPSSNLLNLHFDAFKNIGVPKAITLADINCLVIMTDLGFIYTYSFISKQWIFVLKDSNYTSYGLLEAIRLADSTLCAIGNITGSVKIFSLSSAQTCKELKHHEGKVHSLTWVASSSLLSTDTCSLFSSGPNGVIIWNEVTCVSGNLTSVTERCRFLLPTCKQRWHTSIAFVPEEGLIVCGDRRGSLVLFPNSVSGANSNENITDGSLQSANNNTKNSNVPRQEGQEAEAVHVLFGLHGKLGVTSVVYHNGFVYSSGRDGFYRQLKVERRQLVMLRKLKACKGMEWIERVSFTPDGNLHILGFHSTDFVVWSTRTNEKLLCIPCGGGHRSWSYKKEDSNEMFAYIKSGDVFTYYSKASERIQNVLKETLHGRELTSVRYAGTIKNSSKELLDIIITSSEDTTVNLWAFSANSRHLYCLSTISDHLSSVKTLALARTKHQDGILSTLLFTAGGRAQIEVYRLLIQAGEVNDNITCQVIHVASHRLDEHWDRIRNKHRMVKIDPETRYLSVTTVDEIPESRKPASSSVYLAAACSDGSIRFFVMSESSRQIILVAESFYHQCCVLKVETFVHTSSNNSRVMLCSAATDGRIAFWDISGTVSCADRILEKEDTNSSLQHLGPVCFTVSTHQSGINSLCIQMTTEGQYLVASGGDDNSICVYWLILDHNSQDDPKGGVQLLRSVSVSSAHAAHVTGLRILRDDLLVSASVDQRLTLWNIRDSGLQHVATRFCHVADVSELDVWTHDKEHLCVLCGQGLEIVKCNH